MFIKSHQSATKKSTCKNTQCIVLEDEVYTYVEEQVLPEKWHYVFLFSQNQKIGENFWV